MNEYMLNDLTFTPKELTVIPRGMGRDEDYDMELIERESKKNREIGARLLAEFEERQRAAGIDQG